MRGIRSLFEASRPKGPSDDGDDLTSTDESSSVFLYTGTNLWNFLSTEDQAVVEFSSKYQEFYD